MCRNVAIFQYVSKPKNISSNFLLYKNSNKDQYDV